MIRTICRFSIEDRKEIAKKLGSYGILDCYGFHKFVYSLFPIELDAKFSYNASNEDYYGNMTVVVQSNSEPKLDGLEKYDIVVKNIKDKSEQKQFCLLMNSVKKAAKTGHYSPVSEMEFPSWLQQRAGENGFRVDLDSLHIRKRYSLNFTDKNSKDRKIYATECMGILTVLDPERFEEAAVNGIGRSKAYGFGMILF